MQIKAATMEDYNIAFDYLRSFGHLTHMTMKKRKRSMRKCLQMQIVLCFCIR